MVFAILTLNRIKMLKTNLSYRVNFLMNPDDYDTLRKTVKDEGIEVSSFIRRALGNELDRLNTYIKEKNQTWDIE